MSKIKYIPLAAVSLLILLILFRNFLVYQPIVNLLEKRFEKKWECEIERERAYLSPLKGSLRFSDGHLTTPANAVSRWTLDVEELFIQIDYSSLFSANLIVKELILDGLTFSYEQTGSTVLKRKTVPLPMITKPIDKEGAGKEHVKRKGSYVRNLVIRGGSFSFNYLTSSGKASVITVDNVTLHRRDIFLGRDLYAFFRWLLEPLGYFTYIRP